MDFLVQAFSFILHIDSHLNALIESYGIFTYILLFLIVFMETGFVVTPFLPGDSLLFAAGAFAALGSLDVIILYISLSIAAIAGDTVNYWIGHTIGPKAFSGKIRFLKREYLDKTHEYFEKYGGKTIIIARFIPIVRTFAPFVAGVGAMTYGKFILFNVFGGLLWVTIFLLGGYFFGNIPFVKDNFSLVVIVIIVMSIIPPIIEIVKAKKEHGKHKHATADINTE